MFEIRFLDTFAFMGTSLDKLSENLKDGCKTIMDFRNIFKINKIYYINPNHQYTSN